MRVDCHCHILYGVDDASKCWEDSLAMLKIAVQDGIDCIVATSHVHYKFPENNSRRFDDALKQVQKLIDDYKLPIRVVKGGEIYFSHHSEGIMDDDRLITMGNSRCVLTELPWVKDERDQEAEDIIEALLKRDYIPIIAHPERYEIVHKNYALLKKWRQMGCYLQSNRTSLLGLDRMPIANEIAQRMLDDELIDLVASDAHRSFAPRIPVLSDVYEYINTRKGKVMAEQLCGERAKKLFLDD